MPAKGRMRFHSVTVQALNHPEEEKILARELNVSLVNQTRGYEIAPRT
jgi:hypothetical protein